MLEQEVTHIIGDPESVLLPALDVDICLSDKILYERVTLKRNDIVTGLHEQFEALRPPELGNCNPVYAQFDRHPCAADRRSLVTRHDDPNSAVFPLGIFMIALKNVVDRNGIGRLDRSGMTGAARDKQKSKQ